MPASGQQRGTLNGCRKHILHLAQRATHRGVESSTGAVIVRESCACGTVVLSRKCMVEENAEGAREFGRPPDRSGRMLSGPTRWSTPAGGVLHILDTPITVYHGIVPRGGAAARWDSVTPVRAGPRLVDNREAPCDAASAGRSPAPERWPSGRFEEAGHHALVSWVFVARREALFVISVWFARYGRRAAD